MPPPNEAPQDARVQALLNDIITGVNGVVQQHAQQLGQRNGEHVNAVATQMLKTIQQHVTQLAHHLAPQNRAVEVVRVTEQGAPVPQQTTTPQLLAELNDNMMDMCDLMENLSRQMAQLNKLTKQAIKQSGNVVDDDEETPRRRRRRS